MWLGVVIAAACVCGTVTTLLVLYSRARARRRERERAQRDLERHFPWVNARRNEDQPWQGEDDAQRAWRVSRVRTHAGPIEGEVVHLEVGEREDVGVVWTEYTLDLRAYDEAPPASKHAPEVRARVTESGGLLIESSTMAAGAPYLADAELIDAGVAASGARVAAVDRWGHIHVLRLARSSS